MFVPYYTFKYKNKDPKSQSVLSQELIELQEVIVVPYCCTVAVPMPIILSTMFLPFSSPFSHHQTLAVKVAARPHFSMFIFFTYLINNLPDRLKCDKALQYYMI